MRQELETKLAGLIKSEFGVSMAVDLTRPDEKFGDYASNVALQLGAKLNKSPREIAEHIKTKLLNSRGKTLAKVEVAAPGFLNLKLSDESLLESLAVEPKKIRAGQKTVIETNNPNPFKDMHIGHAFNSVLADTVANLLAASGADLHRVSYHGDVGLHVGKSMWAILKFVDGDAGKLQQISDLGRPKFLSEKYAEGAAAYDQDDLAKQEIERLIKESFTLSDPLFKQVYETCNGWSFTYFDQVFQAIGSQPVEKRYLESQADEAGRQVVEKNIGKVFEKSDSAIIFVGEKYGLHTRVFISSRGTTLYEARDLGLMQLKQQDFNPSKSYIVTAVEQKEYFRVVIKAAELAMPELSNITKNISTGTIKLSTGKMSSRQGTAINVGWLFDEIERALINRGASTQSLQAGITGALRYQMLKNRLGSDVVFDVNEAISLDGNSGPYLQYAHARARSIVAKSIESLPARGQSSGIAGLGELDLDPGERMLVRKMTEYPEVVELAMAELMPHHICSYLYELAQEFNRFYEYNRVLGDERQDLRLRLVETYTITLRVGLELLGIAAPDNM